MLTSKADNTEETLAAFVKAHGGHRVIRKILIANNGIAAVKEIRSIRQFAYEQFGDERLISFTAIATPEDLEANAEYIRMADQYVEVPGGANHNNYANVDLIRDLAERCGVDAVWAGWGHASENPKLPDALKKIGVVFIGPPSSAMRSLGDKISSTIVAQSANVPALPWSGSSVVLPPDVERGPDEYVTVPESLYMQACVQDVDEGLMHAEEIGFPVMIKASEGGGGKGIRKVTQRAEFKQAFEQCLREVPGSPIFIMKLASHARHLEVQVLADEYGNAVSLFGRDCSVQRRHQKIIEEAPVTVASEETFLEMEKAAVRLAKMVGYVSAGTVEYLYDTINDNFYFLELNPRLQVEHPCTEIVSGVNLPAAQLQVAMGIPLKSICDIRKLYQLDEFPGEDVDFDQIHSSDLRPHPKGHVIAARITAENPDAGFKPNGGTMQELNFRSSSNVWGYFSVGVSGGLHEFADSQFGHLFAYGNDREQARKNLILALKQLSIRGDFRTTVEYLIKLLQTDDFSQNSIHTGWLDGLIKANVQAEKPDKFVAVLCCAFGKAYMAFTQGEKDFLSSLERGQVDSKDLLKPEMTFPVVYDGYKYKMKVVRTSADSLAASLDGKSKFVEVKCKALSDGGILMLFDRKSHTVYIKEEVTGTRVIINGKTCVFEKENNPSELRSPSTGKIVKFRVSNGQHVTANTAYAEMEVMKMCMPLITTEPGKIMLLKQEGSLVEAGELVASLVLDDPSGVKRALDYSGELPDFVSVFQKDDKPHMLLKQSLKKIRCVMEGFFSLHKPGVLVEELFEALRNPSLPNSELENVLSSLSGRIPVDLELALRSKVVSASGAVLPVAELLDMIEKRLSSDSDGQVKASLEPLVTTLRKFQNGPQGHEESIVCQILENFHETHEQFDKISTTGNGSSESFVTTEGVILMLKESKFDNDAIVEAYRSHMKVQTIASLVMDLISKIRVVHGSQNNAAYLPILKKIAQLSSPSVSRCSQKAKEHLLHSFVPSYEERSASIESILEKAVRGSNGGNNSMKIHSYRIPSIEMLREIIYSNYTIFDVLTPFFFHNNYWVQLAALEAYIRRAYKDYNLKNVRHHISSAPFFVEWDFSLETVTDGNNSPYKENPRKGIMAAFRSLEAVRMRLSELLSIFGKREPHDETVRLLNLAILDEEGISSNDFADLANTVISDFAEEFIKFGLRRITFILVKPADNYPAYFTYKPKFSADKLCYELPFTEDVNIRNVDPAHSHQLELGRLSNFRITPALNVDSRSIHVYYAESIEDPSDKRFFVRCFVRPIRLRNDEDTEMVSPATIEYLISEGDRILSAALDALEFVLDKHKDVQCNHLFVHFSPHFINVRPETADKVFPGFLSRHGSKLWKLRVTEGEIKISIKPTPDGPVLPLRVYINNSSGYSANMDIYHETKWGSKSAVLTHIKVPGFFGKGDKNGMLASYSYPKRTEIEMKRNRAQSLGTSYVHDFPDIFRQALYILWKTNGLMAPLYDSLLTAKELVLDQSNNELRLVSRDPGLNDIGMVGWVLNMKTPDYPEGREIVVLANDITFQVGSFGPVEDLFFAEVSQYAREKGIPRVYLSANSGARIGLADELMDLIQVKWKDETNKEKGFYYLYLSFENYEVLKTKCDGDISKSVKIEPVLNDDKEISHYKILDIVGLKHGLGVENLQGSGMIAGETSSAYKDIFTITMVTGRSVGIGAYLVRLGQRTVQIEGNPIVLTGASALNKVLGREVYTSNLQLGGTQIMYLNGVSHITANDDLSGIGQVLNWLTFVKRSKDAPGLHLFPTTDPVDRSVDFVPPEGAYDPRLLLDASFDEDGAAGLFDKGSFVETMSGWAKSVVTGRARLGGLPVGVIVVETRATDTVIPADPANIESHRQVLVQAGQVWFPNSAFKTAQAIRDFNNGEQLPLFILANWRGFSGGMMDMFNEILKFGAMIVDELRDYKQPVFVYLPPNAELRGGAWVVVDPKINEDMMEMYADPSSRGGVLEPEGIVEIKCRRSQKLKLLQRWDSEYAELKRLHTSDPANMEVEKRMEERERKLLPMVSQVCVEFAELHDKPHRMKAKGAIREIIEWEKLLEEEVRKVLSKESSILSTKKLISRQECTNLLKTMHTAAGNEPIVFENDRFVAQFLEDELKTKTLINAKAKLLRSESLANMITSLSADDSKLLQKIVLSGLDEKLEE
ncbi:hypothetical protein MP638_005589 [Amoeboaphelidium occidentale]|nr:hypothetical protein MP638_005589 [Amoeboaphelidium occidentale]